MLSVSIDMSTTAATAATAADTAATADTTAATAAAADTAELDCNPIVIFQDTHEYKGLPDLLIQVSHNYNQHIVNLNDIDSASVGRTLYAARGGTFSNILNVKISDDVIQLEALMAKIPKDSDLTPPRPYFTRCFKKRNFRSEECSCSCRNTSAAFPQKNHERIPQ